MLKLRCKHFSADRDLCGIMWAEIMTIKLTWTTLLYANITCREAVKQLKPRLVYTMPQQDHVTLKWGKIKQLINLEQAPLFRRELHLICPKGLNSPYHKWQDHVRWVFMLEQRCSFQMCASPDILRKMLFLVWVRVPQEQSCQEAHGVKPSKY